MPNPTYDDAIKIARDLIADSATTNPEYARGAVEVIADMFGETGVYIADRKMQVAHDIGIEVR